MLHGLRWKTYVTKKGDAGQHLFQFQSTAFPCSISSFSQHLFCARGCVGPVSIHLPGLTRFHLAAGEPSRLLVERTYFCKLSL